MKCKFNGIEEYLKIATDEQVKALNEEHKKIVKDVRKNYEFWLCDDEFGIDLLDEEGLKKEIECCKNHELDSNYERWFNDYFTEIFDSHEYNTLCGVFEWYQKNGYKNFDFCWNNIREKIDFLDIKLAAEKVYEKELRNRLKHLRKENE